MQYVHQVGSIYKRLYTAARSTGHKILHQNDSISYTGRESEKVTVRWLNIDDRIA